MFFKFSHYHGASVFICVINNCSFHSGRALLPQPAAASAGAEAMRHPAWGHTAPAPTQAHAQSSQLFKDTAVQSHTDTNEEEMRIISSRSVHTWLSFAYGFIMPNTSSSFILLLVL